MAFTQFPLDISAIVVDLDGTMVDMSYPAIEQAAKDKTAILWPMGVIEEHGPALPLGTDIYQSTARMKRVSISVAGDASAQVQHCS